MLIGSAGCANAEHSTRCVDELTPGLADQQFGGWVRFRRALLEERLEQHARSLADLKLALEDSSLPAKNRLAMLNDVANIRSSVLAKRVEKLVAAGKFAAAYALIDDVLDPNVWDVAAGNRTQLRAFVSAQEAASKTASDEKSG